jgi:fatty acid desaturase
VRALITRIHGRYYDLTGFAHPGGCAALECARDRDATTLFESYHALHRALPLRTMRQYEISPEQAEAPGRFLDVARFGSGGVDWPLTINSAFRRDVLACATGYFEEERQRRRLPSLRAAMKATPRRWLEIASLGALFFASLPFLVRGSWLALLVTPVLGWVFLVNFWHDALHFALSRHWRINALIPYLFPWFVSPKLWMHQHVIGHHVHTNDPARDPDIRAVPRVLRQAPGLAWCPMHARQGRRLRLLVMYALPLLVKHAIRDQRQRASGWFNDAVPLVFGSPWRRWLHVAGRIAVAASLFAWPFLVFPVWKALAFALAPTLILSELYLLFTQINHVTEPNLTAGDRPGPNWYETQVRTSCSYAMHSYFAFILSGGLNLQIEHHLLPGVNHVHLFRLSPQIREICGNHGVPYHSYPSFAAAFRAHLAALRALSKPSPAAKSRLAV